MPRDSSAKTPIDAAQAVLRGIFFGLVLGSILSVLKDNPLSPIGHAFFALVLTVFFLSLPHQIVLQRSKREKAAAHSHEMNQFLFVPG